MITQAEIYTALRYAGVVFGTGASIAVTLGTVDGETAQSIVTAFQQLMTDLQLVVGDAYKLSVLVFPVAIALLARVGVHAASPKAQVQAVQALPVAQVLVSDPALVTPGVKLVSQAVVTANGR